MLAINNFQHIVSHGGEIKKDLAWEQFIFYLSFTLFPTQFAQSCFEKGGVTKHGALDNLARRSSRWGYQTNFCGFFLILTNKRSWHLVSFSQIYLKGWSQVTVNLKLPTIPFRITEYFIPTTILETAVYDTPSFLPQWPVLLHALLKRTRYRDRKNIYIISSVGWVIPYKIEILRASVLQLKLECLKYGRATLRTIRVPFRRTTG